VGQVFLRLLVPFHLGQDPEVRGGMVGVGGEALQTLIRVDVDEGRGKARRGRGLT